MTVYHIWDDVTEQKDYYREEHFIVLDYDLTMCGRWIPKEDDTNIVCGLSEVVPKPKADCEACILMKFERGANDG